MNQTISILNRVSEAWWNVVLHAFWQTALVTVVILLVVRLGRRLPSPLRYGLVLVALVKFAVPPFLALPTGVFSRINVLQPDHETLTAHSTERLAADHSRATDLATLRRADDRPTTAAPPNRSNSSPRKLISEAVHSTTARHRPALAPPSVWTLGWRAWLMLLHGAGALLAGALMAAQYLRVRRLARGAKEISSGDLFELFGEVAGQLGIRRPIRLLICEQPITPMSFGTLRPMVLLPAGLVEQLPVDQQRALIGHELAHHRRWDLITMWVQLGVLAAWWFHPLAWIVNRILVRLREDCCDDLLLHRRVTTPSRYCATLVQAMQWCSTRARRRAHLLVLPRLHPLGSRVRRVMDATLPRSSRLSPAGFVAIAAAACLVLPGVVRHRVAAGSGHPHGTAQRNRPLQFVQDSPQRALFDRYGDPLPPGAIARLGTIRYRHNSDARKFLYFLPDGKRLVTVSRSVRVWEALTGRLLRDFDAGARTLKVAKPTADGIFLPVLATEFNEEKQVFINELELWDTATWEAKTVAKWSGALARNIACTPDGTTMVATDEAIEGTTLRFFDTASGESRLNHVLPTKFQASGMDFSPDGSLLAVAVFNDGVYLWDWASGEAPKKLEGAPQAAGNVVFSSDRKLLAIATGESAAELWDVGQRRKVSQLVGEADRYGPGVAFVADGQQLAAPGFSPEVVEMFDVTSGRLLRSLDAAMHGALLAVGNVAVSPDGRLLAAAGDLATIKVWDLSTGRLLGADRDGHDYQPMVSQFSPDAQTVATAVNVDPAIRIWNANSGRQIASIEHPGPYAIAVSGAGTRLASLGLDDTLRLWNTATWKPIVTLPGHGQTGGTHFAALAFTPDDLCIVSFGGDRILRLWDSRTGKVVAEHSIQFAGDPLALANDPNFAVWKAYEVVERARLNADAKKLLVSFPAGGGLCVFDVTSGRRVDRFRPEHALVDFAVSPDGKLLASVEQRPEDTDPYPPANSYRWWHRKTTLRLRELSSKKVIRAIELPGYSYQITFSPDGGLLAATLHRWLPNPKQPAERWISVWQVDNGREYARVKGYSGQPFGLAFSPEGTRLITASPDATAIVWDLEKFRPRRP